MKMYPLNILLDSSVFRKENFLASTAIKSLVNLVEVGIVRLHTDKILISEILILIQDQVNVLGASIGKSQIIENSTKYDLKRIKEAIKNGKLNDELSKNFLSFVKNKIEFVHQSSDLPATEVFKKYFENTAPFGSGKKKNEFPDAFVLLGVEKWAIDNDTVVTVVSSDSDWEEFSNNSPYIEFYKNLGELIDYLNKNKHFYPFIDNYLKISEKKLVKIAIKEFMSLNFLLQAEWDGTVDNIYVDGMYMIDHFILDIQEKTAVVELRLEAVFEAELTLDYSDEEGYSRIIRNFANHEEILRAKIEIDISKPSSFKLLSFKFLRDTVKVWPDLRDEYY